MNNRKYYTQRLKVIQAFKVHPKTMKMVEVETGIDRANICRLFGKFRRQPNFPLNFHGTGICPITKHRAGFYTIG